VNSWRSRNANKYSSRRLFSNMDIYRIGTVQPLRLSANYNNTVSIVFVLAGSCRFKKTAVSSLSFTMSALYTLGAANEAVLNILDESCF